MQITEVLTDIADAIRLKEKSVGKIPLVDFADRIRNLQIGSAITLESISATKTITSYNIGDILSTDDIVVIAHYSDSSTYDVTSSVVIDTTSVNMGVVGNGNINITYMEDSITKTTLIEITIVESGNIPTEIAVNEVVTQYTLKPNCDTTFTSPLTKLNLLLEVSDTDDDIYIATFTANEENGLLLSTPIDYRWSTNITPILEAGKTYNIMFEKSSKTISIGEGEE